MRVSPEIDSVRDQLGSLVVLPQRNWSQLIQGMSICGFVQETGSSFQLSHYVRILAPSRSVFLCAKKSYLNRSLTKSDLKSRVEDDLCMLAREPYYRRLLVVDLYS